MGVGPSGRLLQATLSVVKLTQLSVELLSRHLRGLLRECMALVRVHVPHSLVIENALTCAVGGTLLVHGNLPVSATNALRCERARIR